MSRSGYVLAAKGILGMTMTTHDRWNGEFLLLGVFEEVEDIIADDNACFT